jgi:phosphopentomutase
MAGILLDKPFPIYPHGFPLEFMAEYERRIGRGTLCNKPASGTQIIEELGAEHMATGKPIIYTSADSVFQIAAHEQVIPIEQQYRLCEIAREMLRGEHEVGRVIARPFIGTPGHFTRTSNRHDYAVPPPSGMLLDRLVEVGTQVWGVGKISDIFLGRGIARSFKTKSNSDGMTQTLEAVSGLDRGLIWVNLVDFDMLYGHRNDPEGYSRALEETDAWLPRLIATLGAEDLVILTADHGCDPTSPSTDHSREYVPVLCYGKNARSGVNLGTRASMADMGATIAENSGAALGPGQSFLAAITSE